jgi:hypothetical protein
VLDGIYDMTNFYPPDKLPQMKCNQAPDSAANDNNSKRTLTYIVYFGVLGILITAIGFILTKNLLWIIAIPVLVIFGWYCNKRHLPSRYDSGPVHW